MRLRTSQESGGEGAALTTVNKKKTMKCHSVMAVWISFNTSMREEIGDRKEE